MPPCRLALIIAPADSLAAVLQFSLLATGLPREEFDVHVLSLSREVRALPSLQAAGIEVTTILERGRLDPTTFLRTRQWLKRLRPHLVHTWLPTANGYGRAAALSCKLVPCVATLRSAAEGRDWLSAAIDRTLSRCTARVVVGSVALSDACAARGIRPESIAVIPNGVPPHVPSGQPREALLNELGLPPDARLIATLSRLEQSERLKDAIWAADLLKVIRDDVHLLILGDGSQRDALKRFRDNVEIRDRVHFLGHRDDSLRFIEHCDLLWSAGGGDALPSGVLQALAAGVPVVAANSAGVRELVRHGEQGYLVPIGDRAALARFANKLLNDPPLAQQMGQAGQQRMTVEFSVDSMVRRHADMYRELNI